jgi:hypothetical protein
VVRQLRALRVRRVSLDVLEVLGHLVLMDQGVRWVALDSLDVKGQKEWLDLTALLDLRVYLVYLDLEAYR